MKQNFQKLIVLTLVLGGLMISSCSEITSLCEKANGPVETVTFDLDAISGIDLSNSANVFLQKGAIQEVTITGQRDAVDKLERTVENGVWDIKFNECLNHDDLNIHITLPTINRISVSGSGDVFGEDNFESSEKVTLRITGSGFIALEVDAPEVDSKITGSGDIRLTGNTPFHLIKITGSGDLDAFDCIAIDNTIEITGSGNADIFVDNGVLDATIRGSGDIGYKGTLSSVNVDITGSGQVVDRN